MSSANLIRMQISRGMRLSAVRLAGDSSRDGAIREAGGAFGKKEAAAEEQYFRKLQSEQLKQLKTTVTDEIAFYESKIKEHQEMLEKAKDRLKRLENK